jgi:hypothetical protein
VFVCDGANAEWILGRSTETRNRRKDTRFRNDRKYPGRQSVSANTKIMALKNWYVHFVSIETEIFLDLEVQNEFIKQKSN